MKRIHIFKFLIIAISLLLLPFLSKAQKPSDFLPEKPGKWSYATNIKTPGAEVVVLNKNLVTLAEWFHQNIPMFSNPKTGTGTYRCHLKNQ